MTSTRHTVPGPLDPSWRREASPPPRQMQWELQSSILLRRGGQLGGGSAVMGSSYKFMEKGHCHGLAAGS